MRLSKPAYVVGRFGTERHPYTKSRIDQITCLCVCNYSSQTTESICIKIIPANRASYGNCYRLLRFEIFTPTIFKPPKKPISGAVMLNQWEMEDCIYQEVIELESLSLVCE